MSVDLATIPSSREQCLALDAADPLAAFRAEYTLPANGTYLDGNSLGVLPVRTPEVVRRTVEEEWGKDLITSWNKHSWIDLPYRLGDRIAPLVGAGAGEVVVCDSVSVNLFKLLTAALRLRPGRRTVLGERDSFPTDLYIAEGVTGLFEGGRSVLLPSVDDLDAHLDDDVAVVVLSQVDYRTGRLLDMAAITAKVHRAGALMIWDLCHSAGALPIDLTACEVDFAVGCTYKYLNAGPCAPGFLYAAARHHDTVEQPLTGWFSHAAPFAFESDYRPTQGIGRFLTSFPSLLALAGLRATLEIWDRVDLELVRAKSLALTGLFIEQCRADGLEVVTPGQPELRGSQVAVRHPEAFPVVQALIERGVIGDFRAPDLMRFGFTPLYLSYTEVWDAAQALREVLASGEWRAERFSVRGAVT
ncbi:kynureninase [Kitasatospora sp. GAS204A]|uniref:kynureninase n=1 Tax=unclassified Kitasatospora TaxID=2633591 RepID=UPI0024770545|nr:kynureninase [Kitasatospora sp. GAS204B]MDH6115714.1 kynureninase [Kitasatospora sp. GAS204B]